MRRALAAGFALLLALTPPAHAWPQRLELEFIVDDAMLVHALLTRAVRAEAPPDLGAAALDAQTEILKLPEVRYELIHGNWTPPAAGGPPVDAARDAFLARVVALPAFDRVRGETVRWRDLAKAAWDADFPRASRHIASRSGLLIDGHYRVLVLHPAFGAAQNIRSRTILWGGPGAWPHSTTVSIWHEILHDFLPADDLGHVLIQLLTEVDLRRALDPAAPASDYVGHERLRALTASLQPEWEAYLRRPTSVRALYARLRR